MDLLPLNTFTAMLGAALVFAVPTLLLVGVMNVIRSRIAKARATKLVVEARNQLTLGIYDRDEQDNPGPAEILGDVFRLQSQFGIKSEAIGLRDDAEIEELINKALRGNAASVNTPSGKTETQPEMAPQAPSLGVTADDDEPTQPDLNLAAQVAAAHAERNRADENNGVDDILQSCADMSAGLESRIKREDFN